ncbi:MULTISPECIES: gas vesicle protein GvpJ [Rhodococcus]|uniref:gas vesicle protein GvpJ n=1 Tax=Rhodococcus TaxID=1827 RepID=UPI00247378DA|nr:MULTISPECIES: gas vesicle protein GvpJ [Rhodococcus]MDH6291744.1 hypothetical protein [Rhodococcus opacus]MDI9954120.1 gas vesicle protein GvpJ [Rhodococcus sp. IEGM 1305]MDI9973809.1 gas vesicle protein GvpJ [Rhodococcus sp. IEGM 1307]
MTTAGGPSSSSLADVIDTILDKGLVIDARIVVASVDTYLRFAEAANRLAIGSEPKGLSDLVSDVKGSGSTKSKTKGVLEGVGETLGELLGGSGSDREPAPRRRRK